MSKKKKRLDGLTAQGEGVHMLSALIKAILQKDKFLTYNLFAQWMHVSKSTVSRIKNGRNANFYDYCRFFRIIMDFERFSLLGSNILKIMLIALHERKNVVIAVASDKEEEAPKEWVEVIKWES